MYGKERAILFALVSTLLIPVFAADVYRSNSIGQLLEPVSAVQPEGWFAVIDGSDRLLYKDNALVSKTSRRNGWEQTVEDTGNTVTRQYENSQLVSEAIVSPDGARNIVYQYDGGGRLRGYTVSENDKVAQVVSYFHMPDGSVAAIQSIDLTGDSLWEYLGQDMYVQGTRDMTVKLTRLPGNIIIKDVLVGEQPSARKVEISYDADELIVTMTDADEKKQETTYSKSGRILRETTELQGVPSYAADYTYDATGGIATAVWTDQLLGRTVYQTFNNGILEYERVEEGSSLVKLITYHKDGTKTETLYDEDVPYADVTYAPDGKRVLSVSYR